MDPVTHAALGAAIGEITLGRKIGRKAMLWGAAAATLPDLDILLAPLEDDITFLTHHRGFTHCLLFVLVLGPILGWLVGRWHARRPAGTTSWNWTALFLACLSTHVLLDACTTYGTPLLLPLSEYRVALSNIFIVDPLFTLPLLVGAACGLFCRANSRQRRLLSGSGIVLSCLYLSLTFRNKYEAQRALTISLAEQGVEPRRFMTGPTPLNSIVWYCLAEGEDGYYLGYYSLLARRQQIRFAFVPRNDRLLEGIRGSRAMDRLLRFSNGYYTVRREKGGLVFGVLKFGVLSLDSDSSQTAFSFAIEPGADGQPVVRNITRRRDMDLRKLLAKLWRGIRGSPWET
jgi:inner membrane protein